jgi:N4-gp56 family major capsid protein
MPVSAHTFALTPGRLNKYKGQILSHAVPVEVLSRQGRQVEMPKNQSDVYISRRFLPYGATSSSPNTFFSNATGDRGNVIVQAHLTQEGQTPAPESIVSMDVTANVNQYSCLYGFTDKTFYLHEDDIPKEMIKQVGERIALVNELINWGVMRSCTNQFYGGTGTTLATVNGAITLGFLRKITKSLQANHAKPVNSVLKASQLYNTEAVAQGYTIFCHTDMEPDIRDLPGFTPIEKYASGTPMEHEIGKVERMRFITSPDLPSFQDAGAAVGSLNLYSTSASNIDVYPIVVVAQDAWSQLAVRGLSSLDPTYLPPGQKSKSDPFGQRGYAGSIWWKAAMVENNGWMAVGNVGLKNLS